MKAAGPILALIILTGCYFPTMGFPQGSGKEKAEICRPALSPVNQIELGKAGVFSWTCPETNKKGRGYYILFIRPSGTYALFRVGKGESPFTFKPDKAGVWRWMVINTNSDKSKPDKESDTGRFQVIVPSSN